MKVIFILYKNYYYYNVKIGKKIVQFDFDISTFRGEIEIIFCNLKNAKVEGRKYSTFSKCRKLKVEVIWQFKNCEYRSRKFICFDFLSKAEVIEGEMDNPSKLVECNSLRIKVERIL